MEGTDIVSKRAVTDAILDINETIATNLKKYEKAGVIKAGQADAFKEAGKEAQKLITFNEAFRMSGNAAGEMVTPSDAGRAIIQGGPFSLAAYYTGADPFTATAVGTIMGTPTGQGIVGMAAQKAEAIGSSIATPLEPFARSAARSESSATPTERKPELLPFATGPVDPDFETKLNGLIPGGAVLPTENSEEDFSSALDKLIPGYKPETAASAPGEAITDNLPSQDVAASADGAALSGLDNYYKALAGTESSFNTKAKNPTSSAKGLFGMVDDTARRLGVADATDPTQAMAGIQDLTGRHAKVFGNDPETLYAAHFLGQNTLSKVLKGEALDKDQAKWVQDFTANALPRFQQQYQLTQQPTPEYTAQSSSIDDLLKLFS